MRVLIFTQHFVPEITAARMRTEAFAEGLAARGHEVEVICAVPNHPQGVVQPGYRGRAVVRRQLDGYEVRHVWVRASPRKTKLNRILLYGSFAAMATAAGALARRPDVVLVSSPPLPAAAAAALVAARHRVPWVFDVRDLWPEAALVLGELSDGPVARAAAVLERRLYRSADAIVTVTEPFRNDIAAHLDDPGKISVIMNGTTREWLRAGATAPDREALGLDQDEFIWAYAGNLGIAQGFEAAVEAAGLLGDGHRLIAIGDGPRREALERQARDLEAGAVEFRGLLEPETTARYLRAADALLVPLDSQPALRKYVPSKLFDYCALGRPVIVSAAGEPARLIAEAQAGIAVPPSDPQALAEALIRVRDQPGLRDRLASAAREFASRHVRERQVEDLERILTALEAGRGSPRSAR